MRTWTELEVTDALTPSIGSNICPLCSWCSRSLKIYSSRVCSSGDCLQWRLNLMSLWLEWIFRGVRHFRYLKRKWEKGGFLNNAKCIKGILIMRIFLMKYWWNKIQSNFEHLENINRKFGTKFRAAPIFLKTPEIHQIK